MTKPNLTANQCQAIGCTDAPHGQRGIWCPKHKRMVPAHLHDALFFAMVRRDGTQPALIEEANAAIAEKEKETASAE